MTNDEMNKTTKSRKIQNEIYNYLEILESNTIKQEVMKGKKI